MPGNMAMQHWLRGGFVKTKLEIGGVDDPEEHAADRTVERIMAGGRAGPCNCGDCPQCRAGATTLRRKPVSAGIGPARQAAGGIGLAFTVVARHQPLQDHIKKEAQRRDRQQGARIVETGTGF